jgi:hypothetical protein
LSYSLVVVADGKSVPTFADGKVLRCLVLIVEGVLNLRGYGRERCDRSRAVRMCGEDVR